MTLSFPEKGWSVESVKDSYFGVCGDCGKRTLKKGSRRHAEASIKDHFSAKHAADTFEEGDDDEQCERSA